MIHESKSKLEKQDKNRLSSQAKSEEDKMLRLMRVRRFDNFTAFEMADLCRIKKGNARRGLSNMAGSDSGYRDEYGNFPLVKHNDIRRMDPVTRVRVVTYQYNENYGVRPDTPNGQLSMLDERVNRV